MLILSFGPNLQANDTITLKTTYQGRNLFIQNPPVGNGLYFCTIQVLVNDSLLLDSIQTSAYEIDLSWLKINSTVKVRIVHHKECKPKVMNPIICFPERAFKFVSIQADEKKWTITTKGEAKGEKILVEYFHQKQWVLALETGSKGSALLNTYTFDPINLSGQNKIRFKHINGDGFITYSAIAEYYFNK
jgi:hypothetical protein